MEPLTVATAAALVMKFVLPAIRNFGEQVLEKSTDTASDATVGFGRRLLHVLLSGRGRVAGLEDGIERRVRAIAADPGQVSAQIQLEGSIEDLLTADRELRARVYELLAKAPVQAARQGDRSSHVGGNNSGTIITGDGNMVSDRWPR